MMKIMIRFFKLILMIMLLDIDEIIQISRQSTIMMIIMSNMIMMKEITTKDNCEPINKDCLFNRSNCLQSDLLTKRCICLS